MIATRLHFARALPCVLSVLVAFSACHSLYAAVALDTTIPNDTPALSVAEVTGIVQNAVGALKAANLSGIVCVTDREGHILALYRMTPRTSEDVRINEQAIVKARTAAFFESDGDAFTTRTAQFIVQSHFPPGIANLDGGPLFGVPFSSLPGSDVQLQQTFFVFVNGVNAPIGSPAGSSDFRPPSQPLIITPLSDDPGGLPLFKKVGNKPFAVGAIGVEVDGFGVLANGIPDAGLLHIDPNGTSKENQEEQAALAGQKGFEPPGAIQASRVLVNGFRFPYVAVRPPKNFSSIDLNAEGKFEPVNDTAGAPPVPATSQPRATPAQEFPRQGFVPRFPIKASADGQLTTSDVRTIIQQAANQAFITRGAIRRPIGVAAEVWITVVDTNSNILGVFRTNDATIFSFDVAVQKARTALFFSNNTLAFSTRAIGFMSQTLYPPGITIDITGPLSGLLPPGSADPAHLGNPLTTPIPLESGTGVLHEISHLLTDTGVDFKPATLSQAVQTLARRIPHCRDGRLSPVQVSLSVDLAFGRPSDTVAPPPTTIPNGITIFPGGVPLYKNGIMVGAVGVSGDGVDQDDVISFAGQKGFEPPLRCDEATSEQVVEALKLAVNKMKTQFPNLTDGKDAVLDIVTSKLLEDPNTVLQNLRLPYVKFPRELKR